MKLILKIAIPFIVAFLIVAIYVNYEVSKPKVYNDLICLKGKVLHKWTDEEAPIYTRAKNLYCEYEKDILIINEVTDCDTSTH